MRFAGRVLLVLAVFLGVGYAAMRLVLAHSAGSLAPVSEVRLAAEMAGLFSGGAAACLVGIVLLWGRKPRA